MKNGILTTSNVILFRSIKLLFDAHLDAFATLVFNGQICNTHIFSFVRGPCVVLSLSD